MKLRSVLLAVVATLATAMAPSARAEDPKVLVAARSDGALVKVTLVGRAALVDVVVPAREGTYLIPTQANGPFVSYASYTERGDTTLSDVGIVDGRSGARTVVTRDGRSGHLLVSPDRRFRYILTANSGGDLVSLVRTDASGRGRKTLLAGPTGRAAKNNEVQLSGAGISPDGRTVYVARTPGMAPSTLYAVNTSTGAKRVIRHGTTPKYIYNVVASPDGKTVAVSYTTDKENGVSVALVPASGGEPRVVTTHGDLFASSFTADSGGLVLSHSIYAGTSDLGYVGVTDTMLSLADIESGLITPIAGTAGIFQAVPVS